MVRRKKDWWKSGKLKPEERYRKGKSYTYNPISEYTETKIAKDFNPKYELEYPYEYRDKRHETDYHETGKAYFETFAQAKEAKEVGEQEDYFDYDDAPYVIRKIKSKAKPKKKSKSMIKKPKSMVKKATRKMRRK